MSSISNIEDNIIQILKQVLPDIDIDTLPLPIREAIQKTVRTPVIWVVYGGSKFLPNRSITNFVIQHVRYTFYILIIANKLRSFKQQSRGIYEILETARIALAGEEINNKTIEIVSENIQDEYDNLFVYNLVINVTGEFRKNL